MPVKIPVSKNVRINSYQAYTSSFRLTTDTSAKAVNGPRKPSPKAPCNPVQLKQSQHQPADSAAR
jgi:hypothetical protein